MHQDMQILSVKLENKGEKVQGNRFGNNSLDMTRTAQTTKEKNR